MTDGTEDMTDAEREFWSDPVLVAALERVNDHPERRRTRPLRNQDRYVPEKPNTPRFGLAKLGPSYAVTDQQRKAEVISPIPSIDWAMNLLRDFNLNPAASDNYAWTKLSSVGLHNLTPFEPDQTPSAEPVVAVTIEEAKRVLDVFSGLKERTPLDFRIISKLWNFVEKNRETPDA